MAQFRIKYYVYYLTPDGCWNEYAYEKNKKRTLRIARELAKENKKVIIKSLSRKIIWSN